jgi:hypothetical protein
MGRKLAMKTQEPVNYQDLDENIRELVRVLNEIPGVKTIGSCGGHDNPAHGQWGQGTWYVKFELDRTTPALTWLSWAINHALRREHSVTFLPTMPLPHLNPDVEVLWLIEGYDVTLTPDDVANYLNQEVLPELMPADYYSRCDKHGDQWEPGCPHCEACVQHQHECSVKEQLNRSEAAREFLRRCVQEQAKREQTNRKKGRG